MARPLLTLSGFGFGASAGIAALVLPVLAAAAVSLALLCCFAALQHLRDAEVASETATAHIRGGRR